MLNKVVTHARNGTLLKVAKRKLRLTFVGNKPAGDIYYGDSAAKYDDERYGKQYWDDQQSSAEALIRSFPDGIEVLDVPFGTGRFVDVYNEKAMKVSGVEISDEMVKAAFDKRGAAMEGYDVRVGDATSLPFDDAAFDLVLSYRFLTEIISISQAKQVLTEIHRVTRDAALLDLGIRDPKLEERKLPRPTERMGTALSERQVRAMLADAGFTVESITPAYVSGEGQRVSILCRRAT
jgi:ubiquinone/menaquinone biosynthesis C-methylase UbiE